MYHFPKILDHIIMMIFAAEVRLRNLIKKDLKSYIDCVLGDSSVNRANMVGKYNFQTINEEKLNKKIKNIGKKKGYKKNLF